MATIRNPDTRAINNILAEVRNNRVKKKKTSLPAVGTEIAKTRSSQSPVGKMWKDAGIDLKDLREEV